MKSKQHTAAVKRRWQENNKGKCSVCSAVIGYGPDLCMSCAAKKRLRIRNNKGRYV